MLGLTVNSPTQDYFLPKSQEIVVTHGVNLVQITDNTESEVVTVQTRALLKDNYKYRVKLLSYHNYTYQTEIVDPNRLKITFQFTTPSNPIPKSKLRGRFKFRWMAFTVNYQWVSPSLHTKTLISSDKVIVPLRNFVTTSNAKKIVFVTQKPIHPRNLWEFSFESDHQDAFKFTYQIITHHIVVLIVERTDGPVDWGQQLQVSWKTTTTRKILIESGKVSVGSHGNRSDDLALIPIKLPHHIPTEKTPSFTIKTTLDTVSEGTIHRTSGNLFHLEIYYRPAELADNKKVEWFYYQNIKVDPVESHTIPLTESYVNLDINTENIALPQESNQSSITVRQNLCFNCRWVDNANPEKIYNYFHSVTQLSNSKYRINLNKLMLDRNQDSDKQVIVEVYSMLIRNDSAIVGLTRGYPEQSRYNELIERNWKIYQNINEYQSSHFPLIIFHEGNITYQDQLYIHQFQHNHLLRFVDIAPRCFMPPNIPENQMVDQWYIGYKHMCMFHSCQIWNYVKSYQIIMRIDEDCLLKQPIPEIFDYFKQENLVHLSVPMDEFHQNTMETLPKFAKEFCQKNRITPKNTPLINNKSGFSNVSLTQVKFWLSQGPQKFLRDMAKSEKLYVYRWGDLPIHNVILNIFANHKQICLDYPMLQYYHGSWGSDHP